MICCKQQHTKARLKAPHPPSNKIKLNVIKSVAVGCKKNVESLTKRFNPCLISHLHTPYKWLPEVEISQKFHKMSWKEIFLHRFYFNRKIQLTVHPLKTSLIHNNHLRFAQSSSTVPVCCVLSSLKP